MINRIIYVAVVFVLTSPLLSTNGQSLEYTLSPSYLRYDSTIDIIFTLLGRECSLGDELTLVTRIGSTTINWHSGSYSFSRPDTSTAILSYANYSNAVPYFAQCLADTEIITYTQTPLSVSIPVAPKILDAQILDSGKKSTETNYTEIDDYSSYFQLSAFFDDSTNLAELQIDVGDGDVGSNRKGVFSLTGDTDLLTSTTPTTTVLDLDPQYPNGTVNSYEANATKWAAAKEQQCSADLTAKSQVAGSSEQWHLFTSSINLALNYRPQVISIKAASTSISCEVECSFKSACPFTNVLVTLELFDASNATLGKQLIASSNNNRLIITDISVCKTLVSLAKSKSGLASCTAANSVGTSQAYLSLDQVTNLAGLIFIDDITAAAVLEDWMIAIIVVAGVLFLIIIAGLVAVVVQRKKKGKNDKDNADDGKVDIDYKPNPAPAAPTSSTRMQSSFLPSDPNMGNQEPMPPPDLMAAQYSRVGQPPYTGNEQNGYAMQQFPPPQPRPFSMAGSSVYDGHVSRYGDYDMPYQPQPQPSEYQPRSIAFTNAPRSRQPLVVGGPSGGDAAFDNPAYAGPSTQRQVRAEAIV